jgi:hypothetical protein
MVGQCRRAAAIAVAPSEAISGGFFRCRKAAESTPGLDPPDADAMPAVHSQSSKWARSTGGAFIGRSAMKSSGTSIVRISAKNSRQPKFRKTFASWSFEIGCPFPRLHLGSGYEHKLAGGNKFYMAPT